MIQMQVVVTLALAVIVLTEPCTLLQMLGGVVMLSGSLVTQSQQSPRAGARVSGAMGSATVPTFVPRYAEGMLFGSLAAIAYGTSPIKVRMALRHSGPSSAILGGLIAYASATVGIAVLVGFSIPLQRNVMALRRESMPWFVYSGVMVALAQGFLYSAVAVAPIMLVVPLQQSSVVFRLIFSRLLNPTHEVFGARVIIGAALSIVGACTVSIDSSLILNTVGVPGELARLLQWADLALPRIRRVGASLFSPVVTQSSGPSLKPRRKERRSRSQRDTSRVRNCGQQTSLRAPRAVPAAPRRQKSRRSSTRSAYLPRAAAPGGSHETVPISPGRTTSRISRSSEVPNSLWRMPPGMNSDSPALTRAFLPPSNSRSTQPFMT